MAFPPKVAYQLVYIIAVIPIIAYHTNHKIELIFVVFIRYTLLMRDFSFARI